MVYIYTQWGGQGVVSSTLEPLNSGFFQVLFKSQIKFEGQVAWEQSCIKFKKFNSSSVHSIELSSQFKFSSLDKNWTWTAAQLTIELFWTEFKVNSERVECHLLKREGTTEFCVSWQGKSLVPPLFYKGALHSLWIDFELSSKKFNGELSSSSSSVFLQWTELELTTEFKEKTELNWELQFSFELLYSSGLGDVCKV